MMRRSLRSSSNRSGFSRNVVALFFLDIVVVTERVAAYNNGPMSATPVLGWQSWCAVGKCGTDLCTDEQIRETATALVASGLASKGYTYVVLDDCWHPSRTGDGNTTLVPDPSRFPYGMEALVDFVHGLNLKFGLYTSVGTTTCHGGWSPGSFGYYDTDASTFASWGVDYVKIDWCGRLRSPMGHRKFSEALNATGRPMILELCRGLYQEEPRWGYAPSVAQLWRAAHDHHDDWNSTLLQIQALENKTEWSGPYGWAYGDILTTGGEGCMPYDETKPSHCPGQTDDEYRTEISLYSILSSPLLVGTDVRNLTDVMADLLLNDDVLRVNQDVAHKAYVTTSCTGDKAYVRRLADESVAVAVPNFSDIPTTLGVCLADIILEKPLLDDDVPVRDVWLDDPVATTQGGEYQREIGPHDTLFLIFEDLKVDRVSVSSFAAASSSSSSEAR